MSDAGDAFGETHAVPSPGEGLKHFCVVELRPARLDWLDLSAADRHERALYVRLGDIWLQNWIAPWSRRSPPSPFPVVPAEGGTSLA